MAKWRARAWIGSSEAHVCLVIWDEENMELPRNLDAVVYGGGLLNL